jgi:hypothetical protein
MFLSSLASGKHFGLSIYNNSLAYEFGGQIEDIGSCPFKISNQKYRNLFRLLFPRFAFWSPPQTSAETYFQGWANIIIKDKLCPADIVTLYHLKKYVFVPSERWSGKAHWSCVEENSGFALTVTRCHPCKTTKKITLQRCSKNTDASVTQTTGGWITKGVTPQKFAFALRITSRVDLPLQISFRHLL